MRATPAVEELLSAGFTLMPLKPRSKVPRDAGWRHADYSSFDAEGWLARGGNVGIRLGEEDLVVDIDPRNDGNDSLEKLANDTTFDLDLAAPRVRTGGGGLHLFYRKPADVPVRGKLRDYPGVDFKSGGGFVVAAGSVHPETGRPYAIADDSPPMSAVRAAPASLLALVRRPPPSPRTGAGGELTPEQLETLLAALDACDFGQGGRFHDRWESLMASAHDATGGHGEDVWLDWCASDDAYGEDAREPNRQRWNSFTAGRPGGATLGTLVKYVRDAGGSEAIHHVLGADTRADFDDDVEFTDAQPKRFRRLGVDDLESLPVPEWLVEGWITEFALAQVYGARKKGKTFSVLDLALHVALGREWHGHAVKRKRVTYVIGEGSIGRFYDRVRAWCQLNHVDRTELRGWFTVVGVRVGVDNPADLKDFFAADPEPVGLIVIDTVARSMNGDENSTRDMNAFITGADRIREHYGCAVLLVHHSGKDENKAGRGSTALPGAVDATIKVSTTTDNLIKVELEECRDAEAGRVLTFEPVPVVVDDDLRSSLALRLVDDVDRSSAARDKVLVRLAELGEAKTMSALIAPAEKGMSRANVQKAFGKLIEDGLVTPAKPYRCTEEGLAIAVQMGAEIAQ